MPFETNPCNIKGYSLAIRNLGQATLPHHLWTDAYLASFAIACGCRLVSFDADFVRFPGLNFLHLQP